MKNLQTAKLCTACDSPNRPKANTCTKCGFALNRKAVKPTKQLTYSFKNTFVKQLDAIKQKPPGERKK